MDYLNRDLYDRQQQLPLSIPKEVIVVGLGGTGTWTALFLAMSGVQNLHLMDSDRIESTNLNRLPFPPSSINKGKAEVIAALIQSLRPLVNIEVYPHADQRTLSLVQGEVLIDCTDKHKVQLELQSWCKEQGILYERVGYDGLHITVTSTVPEWSTDEEDDGYAITPSWVIPAALAAAFGVIKLCLFDLSINSEDIRHLVERK